MILAVVVLLVAKSEGHGIFRRREDVIIKRYRVCIGHCQVHSLDSYSNCPASLIKKRGPDASLCTYFRVD